MSEGGRNTEKREEQALGEGREGLGRRGFVLRTMGVLAGSQIFSLPARGQPAAGLDVNKGGGGFEKLDASQLPVDKSKEKSKKRAAGLAVFEDDVCAQCIFPPSSLTPIPPASFSG